MPSGTLRGTPWRKIILGMRVHKQIAMIQIDVEPNTKSLAVINQFVHLFARTFVLLFILLLVFSFILFIVTHCADPPAISSAR